MEAEEAVGAGYQDFTVATTFERFVASVESCVATWASRGPLIGPQRLQAHLHHRLPWRTEPYKLELHVPPSAPPPASSGQSDVEASSLLACYPIADASQLQDAPHRLQQWFGARAFMLLSPDSYSGRVLDAEEAHTLLSAAAVALAHTRISWPLLLPVHDAVREGYRGVAVAPDAAGGATLHYDTDSVQSSRLAPGFLHCDQQLLLFARQLGAAGAPVAAAACRAAAGADVGAAPSSMAADAAAAGGRLGAAAAGAGGAGGLHVALAVRHSYAVPEAGEGGDGTAGSGWEARQGDDSKSDGEWDEQAPWRPWAAQGDPVGCLELDVAWDFPQAAGAVAAQAGSMQEEASQGLLPSEAAAWRVLALAPGYERDTGQRGFVLRPVDKPRRFLHLQSLAGQQAQRILAGGAEVSPDQLPADSSFFGMLLKLVESCTWAARAPDLGALASQAWWQRQGAAPQPPVAPDWVLQEATRDILQMNVLPVWPAFPPGSVAWPTGDDGQHGCLGKAAPLGALVSRFALHALALGSPASVAELWSRLITTLRLQYWEPLRPLPRMRLDRQQEQQQQGQQAAVPDGMGAGLGAGGGSDSRPEAPNLDHSLLHQKLQLLDLCIHLLSEQQHRQQQQQQQEDVWHAPNGVQVAAAVAAAAGAQPTAQAGWEWDSSEEAEPGQVPAEREASQVPRESLSPSSSSSSYFSARGGSDVALSPARSQPQLGQRTMHAGEDGVLEPAAPNGVHAIADDEANGQQQEAAAAATAEKAGAAAGEEPEGAAGVLPGAWLHLHPDRPLRVPVVLEPPPQTEDLMAEQQAALQAMPASPGQDPGALRAQLQGRMLLSDMQAFKAANLGCCLLDFVRWHSPKDCVQAADGSWHLSERMATQGNAWQQLWAAAAPVPAARQRPLLDPQLEGERALHFLETLPPAALFSELLALGYSAALQVLLTAGPAAKLPAVQRQLGCLQAEAGAELAYGVAAVPPPDAQQGAGGAAVGPVAAQPGVGAAAAAQDAAEGDGWEHEWEEEEEQEEQAEAASDGYSAVPPRQPSWLQSLFHAGLSCERYRRLLLLLGCAEQTVVAAHSLLLRLGAKDTQQHPGSGSFDAATAEGLVATALGEQYLIQGAFAGLLVAEAEAAVAPAASVDLPAAHWPAAERLVVLRQADSGAAEASSSANGSEAPCAAGQWPTPFQREWLLQVRAGPGQDSAAGRGGSGGNGAQTAVQDVAGGAASGGKGVLRAVPCGTACTSKRCQVACGLPLWCVPSLAARLDASLE